jgi:outer membrane protein TolC
MLRCFTAFALLAALVVPARAERPLTLADALAMARARRSELAQAELDVRRARLEVLRARLERAHLTVQAGFTEQLQRLNLQGPDAVCRLTPAACAGEVHPFSANASLTVPLWSGFKVEADLAQAHAHERAAGASRRAAANSIALDAANAYWETRRAALTLDVARQALERTREIERTARVRVDAHIAPQIDYERSHVQSVRAAEAVASLSGQWTAARAELGLALQADEPLAPSDDPAAVTPLLPSLQRALADAAAARPELEAARATVEAQRQSVRAAKSGYWPQLSLIAASSAGNQIFYLPGATPGQTVQSEQFVFTALAGLQVNWILFDSLSTWTAVKDAGYLRDRAVADAARLAYEVRAAVIAAHGRLAAALERKTLAADAAASARRALFLLQKRYQVGDTLLLEVIVAQEDLTLAEGDLNDAAVDAAEADAQLQAAMGRL